MGDCIGDDRPHPRDHDGTLVAVELAEGSDEQEGGAAPRKPGGLRREPSFSRWCKDSAANAAGDASAADGNDSEEFELPLLPPAGGGGSYLPMDVEAGEVAKLESCTISPWLVAKILSLILAWYTLSTLLTLYNKEMLGKHMWKFPAPFLMTTVHFTMQAVASRVIVWFQHRHLERGRIRMSWKDYFVRVVPTALGTALDINLSNIALVFITVTFATMCKSAAPIFILLFAFAFRLEKPSFKLFGIILVVSFGVLLTVAKETEFNLWGFIFIMLAAVMSGFRWSMTQILLQKDEYGLKNPFTLMSYVTPVMAIATALFSVTMDPWGDFRMSHFFDNSSHIARSCLLMLLGGALAFFMVLTEYVLVSATSALTVTVAGIVKEAVTILVAVLFFNDPFTWLKGLGLAIIMLGVGLFNLYKYQRFKKVQHSENGSTNFQPSNGGSKYVILDDDVEDQEDTG